MADEGAIGARGSQAEDRRLFRPELVVEIALDGVQSSARYAGAVALRSARLKRYQPDEDAASTIRRTAIQITGNGIEIAAGPSEITEDARSGVRRW